MFLLTLVISSLSSYFAMLPFLIAFHLAVLIKKLNSKKAIPHLAVAYIFCFFVAAILSITGVPSLMYIRIDTNINIVPFTDIFSNFVQYVENILLFIPLGFLLPVLWVKFEKFSLTVAIGALLSLVIEISQLFCYRATDTDDLIMNTLGTLLGFYIYIGIKKIYPKIATVYKESRSIFPKWEVGIYFAIAWLSMFLIEPFISEWIWSFILK